MRGASRHQLIEAGTRLLDRAGPHALRTRTVAEEAGASTMAVYTHFGGMRGLVDAIAAEAFCRLSHAVAVKHTSDPVADLFVIAEAYCRFALQNPQRYLLIFGAFGPKPHSRSNTERSSEPAFTDPAGTAESLDALVSAVHRMIAAGRIRDDGARLIADRLWIVIHGAVMLEIGGFCGHPGRAVTQILVPLAIDVLVGMGDDRASAVRSSRGAPIATRTDLSDVSHGPIGRDG